ncbi:MAG: hypothetical protein NVS2B7_32510 [Herpetosiphon sp.]
MSRTASRLATVLALIITAWLIWQKIHVVLIVQLPWWSLILIAVAAFLLLDYLFSRLFHRPR